MNGRETYSNRSFYYWIDYSFTSDTLAIQTLDSTLLIIPEVKNQSFVVKFTDIFAHSSSHIMNGNQSDSVWLLGTLYISILGFGIRMQSDIRKF